MAYNTVEDDDYINSIKEQIIHDIEALAKGLDHFEKVLTKLAETGITKGTTHDAIIVYSEEVGNLYNKVSGAGGIDYHDKVKMQAEQFVDKVETAGKFLYD